LIFCNIRIQIKCQRAYPRVIWKYNLGDYLSLNEMLANAPWVTMDIFQDIDDAAGYFKSLFLDACKSFIPTKSVTIRPRDEPWMVNDVHRKIRRHTRAYKRWKINPTVVTFEQYNESCTAAEAAKQQAKEHYYTKLSSKLLDPATNAKQFWRLTKELYDTKVKRGIPPLIKDDAVYSTAESKCKLFNKHFAKKAQLPCATDLPALPEFQLETDGSLDFISVTDAEVLKELKDLDTSKATGPDGISNTILKRTADAICRPLCCLFNKSPSSGKFPNEWKEANLSPVFKANDRQSVEN